MIGITMEQINAMSKEELINLAYTQIKYVITDINEEQVRKDNFDNWCHYSKAILYNPNLLKEHAKLGFKGYDECSVIDIIIKLKFNDYEINYETERNRNFIYFDELIDMDEDAVMHLDDNLIVVGLDEDDFREENYEAWRKIMVEEAADSDYISEGCESYEEINVIKIFKTLISADEDIIYQRKGKNNNVL